MSGRSTVRASSERLDVISVWRRFCVSLPGHSDTAGVSTDRGEELAMHTHDTEHTRIYQMSDTRMYH